MTDFNGKLSMLCTEALRESRGNPEAQAEIIERLVNAAAFTVASTCEGDEKTMSVLLAGAEQHLYEAAADHARTVRMIPRLA